jgi:hypothetical protein
VARHGRAPGRPRASRTALAPWVPPPRLILESLADRQRLVFGDARPQLAAVVRTRRAVLISRPGLVADQIPAPTTHRRSYWQGAPRTSRFRAHTKAPEGTGGKPSGSTLAAAIARSPARRRCCRLRPCGHRGPTPWPLRGSLPARFRRFSPAPSGETKCIRRAAIATTAYPRSCDAEREMLSPNCGRRG